MAHTSSGKLSVGQTYNLGQYALRLIVTKVSEESITSIQCNCSKGSEHAQTGIDQPIYENVKSWRIEANESSADVYATVYRESINTDPITKPIPSATSGTFKVGGKTYTEVVTTGGKVTNIRSSNSKGIYFVISSETDGVRLHIKDENGYDVLITNSTWPQRFDGKTVYYTGGEATFSGEIADINPVCNGGVAVTDPLEHTGNVAWCMINGDPGYEKEVLVARFSIDLGDAGGGASGDWDEPGSTGDPSYTLNVTVNGALSGRHNDPLNDTSYHYVPAEQDAATVYGSGGDGGHGGGGGAGASTVVIHSIATERAGNVEETAIAKRHGYGSGGGKGGKGGDGCILVYY